MSRIDWKAVIIAFAAEIGADHLITIFAFAIFAQGMVTPDMSHEEFMKVQKTVIDTTAFVPTMFVRGTLTTILGAYLAARLAKRLPYYHGLAMGIAGIVFSLVFWPDVAKWHDYVGLLITIPASIYGAHLARKHIPQET